MLPGAATSRFRARVRLATATARPVSNIEPDGDGVPPRLQGTGEIGGLVAGVGQRILSSVSKHLVGRFFVALRKEFDAPVAASRADNYASRLRAEGKKTPTAEDALRRDTFGEGVPMNAV